MAVFEAKPEHNIEYVPSEDQMSFAQHFMHLGLINNFYIGILIDSKTSKDFDALIHAKFLVARPDQINLIKQDYLK